jgi:hypothetical protein
VPPAPAAAGSPNAAGFDTALRAALETAPGLALNEGPQDGPEPKSEGRIVAGFMNNPG